MSRGRAPVGAFFPGSSRKPIEHGTIGGYRAHYRHGDLPVCEACRQADREARGLQPFRSGRCGTRYGYMRHGRLGEPACDACKRAQADYQEEWARAARGDQWPYELLIPAVRDLSAQGLTVAEIADSLGVSRLRVGRARARAARGAS